MEMINLPELAAHFAAAIHHLPAVKLQCACLTENIWAAVSHSEELTSEQRNFHLLKFGIAAAGLAASLETLNFIGLLGFGVPMIEEIRDLNQLGKQVIENYKPNL